MLSTNIRKIHKTPVTKNYYKNEYEKSMDEYFLSWRLDIFWLQVNYHWAKNLDQFVESRGSDQGDTKVSHDPDFQTSERTKIKLIRTLH